MILVESYDTTIKVVHVADGAGLEIGKNPIEVTALALLGEIDGCTVVAGDLIATICTVPAVTTAGAVTTVRGAIEVQADELGRVIGGSRAGGLHNNNHGDAVTLLHVEVSTRVVLAVLIERHAISYIKRDCRAWFCSSCFWRRSISMEISSFSRAVYSTSKLSYCRMKCRLSFFRTN